MKTSKTIVVATVTSNNSDKTTDIPRATRYWRKNPRLIMTWCELSKPPRMAFKPFAIKNMDSRKPDDNKPW